MADPIRDTIAKPLADYDAILAERPTLRAAIKAWVDATEFNSPAEEQAAFQLAISQGPAASGQTATPAQAMAQEFLNSAAELQAIGVDAVLALHRCLAIAGIAQPCAVSANFTDGGTYKNLVNGQVS